ncbi:MAG TPA: hypothetical protein VJ440_09950 [Candidatus Brocadiaceae bacterium]|nr:hypothetical protein [Candidatus Brocadiaceae bacterium]
MAKQTCYMCEEIATTKEDVPPRCIFPEAKDVSTNYRKSLIKVPSCIAHNTKKSKDDEYLMLVLTCNIDNNNVAMRQINTKIQRALERKPTLANLLLRDTKPILARGMSTEAFKVDHNRFKRSMDWMVRGLYYNQHKKKWSAKLYIQPTNILIGDGNDELKPSQEWIDAGIKVNQDLSDIPKIGENPDVFWYQMRHDKHEELLINMMFFGGFQVLALSKPGMA